MEFGELFRLRDWRLYHDGDGMATVQCFCREQFPHLFTTRPRVIANGRNYPDSHSISYSFAGLGKLLRIRRAGTPPKISPRESDLLTHLPPPPTPSSPLVTQATIRP